LAARETLPDGHCLTVLAVACYAFGMASEIALVGLGVIIVLVGLAGLVLPALPGTPLIVGGLALIAWADGFTRISGLTLALIALLGSAGWVMDYITGVLGARRAGASRWGVAGAAIGLVAGLPFGLPGLVLGPGLGAALFEYLRDPDFGRALRAGGGVLIGFLVGTVVKYTIAFAMIGIAAFAYAF
jgi:uncharacterized protein YqgC (DUF456 family)